MCYTLKHHLHYCGIRVELNGLTLIADVEMLGLIMVCSHMKVGSLKLVMIQALGKLTLTYRFCPTVTAWMSKWFVESLNKVMEIYKGKFDWMEQMFVAFTFLFFQSPKFVFGAAISLKEDISLRGQHIFTPNSPNIDAWSVALSFKPWCSRYPSSINFGLVRDGVSIYTCYMHSVFSK